MPGALAGYPLPFRRMTARMLRNLVLRVARLVVRRRRVLRKSDSDKAHAVAERRASQPAGAGQGEPEREHGSHLQFGTHQLFPLPFPPQPANQQPENKPEQDSGHGDSTGSYSTSPSSIVIAAKYSASNRGGVKIPGALAVSRLSRPFKSAIKSSCLPDDPSNVSTSISSAATRTSRDAHPAHSPSRSGQPGSGGNSIAREAWASATV